YLLLINPFLDYSVKLASGHQILMLDWAEDEELFNFDDPRTFRTLGEKGSERTHSTPAMACRAIRECLDGSGQDNRHPCSADRTVPGVVGLRAAERRQDLCTGRGFARPQTQRRNHQVDLASAVRDRSQGQSEFVNRRARLVRERARWVHPDSRRS